jgi:hypothetical protein
VRRTDDYAAYQWLEEAGGKPIFAGLEPPGYPAYVRLFHVLYEPAGREAATPATAQSSEARRVRWAELADRLNVQFTGEERDHQFFRASRGRGLPDYIEGVREGSLDDESYLRLTEALLAHSGNVDVVAYYCLLALKTWETPAVFEGRLDEMPSLLQSSNLRSPTTPQNWWPRDRSWVVYTDWDLTTTTICASTALADRLLADDLLECTRVEHVD